MASHYEVLGVSPGATTDEIRAAYRCQARRHHPDAHPDADPGTAADARRTMAALNSAWEVLGHPARRRAYDASLTASWQPLPADPDEPISDDHLDQFDRDERFAGWGEPDDEPVGPRRPADHLVMTPVMLVLAAVALFFFSMLSQWAALRTLAILLLPLAGVGFVAAPLFVMLRGRANDRSP